MNTTTNTNAAGRAAALMLPGDTDCTDMTDDEFEAQYLEVRAQAATAVYLTEKAAYEALPSGPRIPLFGPRLLLTAEQQSALKAKFAALAAMDSAFSAAVGAAGDYADAVARLMD